MALWKTLRDGMADLGGVKIYCGDAEDDHLPLLACNVEGHSAEDVGAILDGDFEIAVRTGLHCAPFVHEDLGTIHTGAIRFSLGVFTTEEDIAKTLRAMALIVGGVSR
jgi:cysteine desulfurase/selenocysteine lyase